MVTVDAQRTARLGSIQPPVMGNDQFSRFAVSRLTTTGQIGKVLLPSNVGKRWSWIQDGAARACRFHRMSQAVARQCRGGCLTFSGVFEWGELHL